MVQQKRNMSRDFCLFALFDLGNKSYQFKFWKCCSVVLSIEIYLIEDLKLLDGMVIHLHTMSVTILLVRSIFCQKDTNKML